jgi:hypothetical protein
MLHEMKILLTAHRESVVWRWYKILDGGWNQTEVLREMCFLHTVMQQFVTDI